jgi:hypothetical protein
MLFFLRGGIIRERRREMGREPKMLKNGRERNNQNKSKV